MPEEVHSQSRPTQGLPIDSPHRRRLPPLLRQAWYSLNKAFRRRISHLGITPDQFTALRILLESNTAGITQRELTESMSSDANTVASLLDRMETAGLVERHQHETDRRARRINILPAGESAYEQARQIAVTLQQESLSAIPESKREEFLFFMARLAESCHKAEENSPKKRRR